MTNIIIIIVVAAVVALALGYIIREKKRGAKCVGCPHSKFCGDCSDCGEK